MQQRLAHLTIIDTMLIRMFQRHAMRAGALRHSTHSEMGCAGVAVSTPLDGGIVPVPASRPTPSRPGPWHWWRVRLRRCGIVRCSSVVREPVASRTLHIMIQPRHGMAHACNVRRAVAKPAWSLFGSGPGVSTAL